MKIIWERGEDRENGKVRSKDARVSRVGFQYIFTSNSFDCFSLESYDSSCITIAMMAFITRINVTNNSII